ncbi:MAG TPA: hypothetical protein VFE62_21090 [Gemmataceae bacterium]|nr:hypothetical protein [Gemmataceae bacterium]
MKRITWLGICSSILLGLAGARAWAKPADLPLPSQHACPEGTEDPAQGGFSIKLDLLSGRITVETGPGKSESTPSIDTVTPALMPGLIDELVRQAGQIVLQRGAVTGKDLEARRCFEKAERARMAQNFETARLGYQQAHLLSPTSLLGRLAIIRLQQVEEQMRDPSEESSEPPTPRNSQSMYRDMNERTIPLGLVHVSY